MDKEKLYGVEEVHSGRLHWVNKDSKTPFDEECKAICMLEGYEKEPDSMGWVETLRDASHGKYILINTNIFRVYDATDDINIAGECVISKDYPETFTYSATFNNSVTMLELVLEEALREEINRKEELPW